MTLSQCCHTYHCDDKASRCALQSGGGEGGLTFVSKYSSHFVHTKRIGESQSESGAEQPFLSNGGLTLVQRRVSFGEKWHERGRE